MKVSVVSYQLAGFNLNINVMHVKFDKCQFLKKKKNLKLGTLILASKFF